jgi:hypothetical protein
MRRDFLFWAAVTCAISAASLLLDGFELAIQKFNLLLLLVDCLIELINQIFSKAKLDFKIGDAIIGHVSSLIFILSVYQFKSTIFHLRFWSDPKIV